MDKGHNFLKNILKNNRKFDNFESDSQKTYEHNKDKKYKCKKLGLMLSPYEKKYVKERNDYGKCNHGNDRHMEICESDNDNYDGHDLSRRRERSYDSAYRGTKYSSNRANSKSSSIKRVSKINTKTPKKILN